MHSNIDIDSCPCLLKLADPRIMPMTDFQLNRSRNIDNVFNEQHTLICYIIAFIISVIYCSAPTDKIQFSFFRLCWLLILIKLFKFNIFFDRDCPKDIFSRLFVTHWYGIKAKNLQFCRKARKIKERPSGPLVARRCIIFASRFSITLWPSPSSCITLHHVYVNNIWHWK